MCNKKTRSIMRVVYNKRFCTHAHAHGYLGHRGLNSLRFAIGKGYERFAVKQIQFTLRK